MSARGALRVLALAVVSANAAGAQPAPAASLSAYTAAMQGRKADTLADVQQLVSMEPIPAVLATGDSGWELTPQYQALLRFGLWDEMIALAPPLPGSAGATAGYLYGRGFALAARGRAAEAQQTLAQLESLAAAVPPGARAGRNTLPEVLAVAVPVLDARIAASAADNARAVERLREAVAAEDRLAPGEPADWFFPVRQLLGAQLLIAGEPGQARQVYREDLKRNPHNGWSLYGLSLALAREGRTAEAARVRHEQQLAWQHADVALPASAFWYAGADTASCECEHRALGHGQPGGQFFRAQYKAGVD